VASKLSSLLAELKRRQVYHVAAVYGAVGLAISVAVPDVFQAFGFPAWAARFVMVVIAIGFPIALVLAWAYEVKPEEPRPGDASGDETPARGSAPVLDSAPALEDPRPSVAVLPFANLSADPENEYFSDGITFDIINHLGKITDLKVISRTSVMRFRATEKPLREIGGELGVTTIVEGEVQRVGDRVRISAQLVDARTDEHLWAEQYDRELIDVFAIQSDVAQRVAAALRATLSSTEKKRIETRPTGNFEAYTLYLRGRYFWDRRPGGLTKALDYFEKALDIDPKYALAHAGVADCFMPLGFFGYLPPREAWPKAKAAAMRALELDGDLAEAHASLGYAKVCYDWDPLAAEKDFKQAIELNPGYAPAYYWYALVFVVLERFEEAVVQHERALEVDPLSVFANAQFGWTLVGTRQFGRAREQLQRTLELDPDLALAHWLLGWGYGMEGGFEDSIRHLQKACELSEGSPWFMAHLGWAYGASGRAEEARAVLSDLRERRSKQFVPSLHFAVVHMGLGETGEALDWLERAYEERDMWMAFLKLDAKFDPLRTEPRFTALLEKVAGP
jgi:TolB-like protein/Flp pilus assembly protein TadD